MLCVIFVTALILPSLAQSNGTKKKNETLSCSDPRVMQFGDEFFECFDITVNNSIKHENMSCATSLNETLTHYVDVANRTCYKKANTLRDGKLFLEMINYSLEMDKYKKFVDNGGRQCINSTKAQISNCVTGEVGHMEGADDIYLKLWKKASLSMGGMPCKQTEQIKMCTMKVIRKDDKCGTSHDYVSSLFDYMLIRCKPYLAATPSQEERHGMDLKISRTLVKDAKTTHILLGLLLTVALLGILYVLVRDCRGAKGHWKTINTQLEMRQRRASLVHNEVHHKDQQ